MERLLVVAALAIGLAMPAWGQNFDSGLDAYERGDYAAALEEWKPLAERGRADAQYKLGPPRNPRRNPRAVLWI